MPAPRYYATFEDAVAGAGSDAEDVAAIQRFLAPASSQVSAAVGKCVLLDQPTKDAWYALSKRILAFVSAPAAASMLTEGRALRDALNATMADLKAKGCGDIASAVATAPPPKDAGPDPNAKPGTLFTELLPSLGGGFGLVLVVGLFLLARSSK
jgi:hypothetical protein